MAQQQLAVKWLIQVQINGDVQLGYRYMGPAPWLAWGAYLWADGLGADGVPGRVPGRGDGLEWSCCDYGNNGIHPSTAGRTKVANKLLAFLKDDTSSTPGYSPEGNSSCAEAAAMWASHCATKFCLQRHGFGWTVVAVGARYPGNSAWHTGIVLRRAGIAFRPLRYRLFVGGQ